MAGWDDVRALALELPEATERVSRDCSQWRVRDKLFVWERPLRKSDMDALGEKAPEGPILGARVDDLVAKEALIADDPNVFFTTPHFDGYPAVLLRIPDLARIDADELYDLVVEAWLTRAQKRVAKAWLQEHGAQGD